MLHACVEKFGVTDTVENFLVKGSTLLLTSYTTCYIPSCCTMAPCTQSSSGPRLKSGASRSNKKGASDPTSNRGSLYFALC